MLRLTSLILVLLFAGCSLTPGMRMSSGNTVSDVEVPVVKDGKLIKEKAKIMPITADLIIDRENARHVALDTLPPADVVNAPYTVGPHDRLQITVWDHPEINDPGGEKILPELAGKVVADDGTLYFPYAGNLPVAGKTVAQVRDMLTQALSKYFKKVKLDVRVLSFQSHRMFVVGEVRTPGIQSFVETPLTVAEAISRAGGVTAEADLGNVSLARDGKLYPIDLFSLYEKGGSVQNILLKNGDVLNVPDRKDNKVFVMGEVGRQQPLQINKGKMTLAQAISEGYGVDFNTSRPEEIYVIRNSQTKPEIFQLNAGSPDGLLLADRFALEPHDIVFVGTAGITQWSRVLNQLLPSSINQMMMRATYMGM